MVTKNRTFVDRLLGRNLTPPEPKQLAEDVSLQTGKSFIVVNPDPVGSSGTRAFSGYTREEYLSTLYGRFAADKYDEMRRSETQLKMCLSAVKNPLRGAHWEIEPTDPNDPAEVRRAELIEHMLFDDLDKPWSHVLGEILTMADFGHSVFEITDKVVLGHKKFGTYNGIRSLGWRSPKTLERWNLDPDTGKLISAVQYAYGDLQRLVEIPAEFLLIFTLDKEGDNYEGISLMRPCFGPWLRKQTFLKLNAIGVERLAIPTPVARVPEGKENSQQYKNLVAALQSWTTHQANYLTLPANWEVDFKTTDYDPSKVQTAIDAENKEMVKAFMANFLELGMSGPGGSYALSYNQADFFLGGIEYIAQSICDEINSILIPRMIKLNFGPQEKYPKIKYSGISDKAGKELAESLKALTDGAVIVADDDLEDHIRKRYQLPKRSTKGQRIPKQAQGGALPTDVVSDNGGTPAPTSEGITSSELAHPNEGPHREDSPEAKARTFPGYGIDRASLLIGTAAELRKTHNVDSAERIAIGNLTKNPSYYLGQRGGAYAEEMTARQRAGTKGTPNTDGTAKKFPGVMAASEGDSIESRELAEAKAKTPRGLIVDSKDMIQKVMLAGLQNVGAAMVSGIMAKAKRLPKSKRLDAVKDLDHTGMRDYKAQLQGAMARVAGNAIEQARKEVPKAKNVKLAEDDFNFTLNEFDRLPAEVQAKIKAMVQAFIDTQGADLDKATVFAFIHSHDSTGDLDIVEADLDAAVSKYVEGAATEVGSTNAAAYVVNEARWAFFSNDEVADEIESYTFMNADPVSPICEDLAGTTFDANDPEASRYFPPLHHNCKSYLSANLKGSGKDMEALRPSDKELDKYMTLGEIPGLIPNGKSKKDLIESVKKKFKRIAAGEKANTKQKP